MKMNKQYSRANIVETLPNKNIFQTDSDYKMMQDLRFDQEEKNCKNNLIARFTEIIPVLIITMILRNYFFLYTEFGLIPKLITLTRIPMILYLKFLLFFSVKNPNKIIEESNFIRLILEIDNILNIIASSCKSKADPGLFLLSIRYLIGFTFNFIFALNMKDCLLFYIVESITLLSFSDYPESFFLIRLIKNIFSKKILKVLSLNSFSLFLQYCLAKGFREIWALYDSFKKSYFILKNIYDEFPYPVFIVNSKRQNYSTCQATAGIGSTSIYNFQIYYKNNEADKLFAQIRNIKDKNFDQMKRNINKKEFTFKELLEPQVEKLFDNELEKCLNGECKFFDFPLIIGDRKISFKENKTFSTLYEGDLHKIKWVRIYANSCHWRSNEAVIIQIINNEDLQNNFLNQEYGANLDLELSRLIENIDIICDKATDINLMKEMEKISSTTRSNSGNVNPNGNNTPNILRSPSPNNHLYQNIMDIKQNKLLANSPQYLGIIGNNPKVDLKSNFQNRLLPPKNNLLNFGNNNSNPHKSNVSNGNTNNQALKEPRSNFDYSTLFLLKNSLNYIQDIYLTINIIIALRMNKIYHKQTKIKFENFIPHIVDYLYPLAKSKKFEFKLNLIEEDIVVVYEYYRVIFFNIIFFILNNTKDESEKTLEISLDHSRWTDHGNYYETSFVFKDESPIIKYESLLNVLKKIVSEEFKNINLEQFKFIDGLIVASFLLSHVHNNLIEIETIGRNTYKIHFCIFGGAVNNMDLKSPSKKFIKSKSQLIEQLFYDRILEKLTPNCMNINIETHDKAKIFNEKSKSDNKNQAENKGNKPIYDEEPDDCNLLKIYFKILDYPEEEKIVKIENDFNLYKEILMSLSIVDIGHKLLQQKNRDEKLKFIKERSKKLHWINKYNLKFNEFSGIWDNSHMQEIKYCPIPRFLIVEDNIYGRLSMKDELKKLELAFQYDVATDGREAVEKFKILLNQGYLFDFIFMDIFLLEMDGVEATKIIREIENQYNCHSNIVAVTLEGKQQIQEVEKPIKNSEKFFSYISTHFAMNRPGTKLKKFR